MFGHSSQHEQLRNLDAAHEELDAAIEAALAVRAALDRLRVDLARAEAAGQNDLFTLSFTASEWKISGLDQANIHLRRLQSLLERYRGALPTLADAAPKIASLGSAGRFLDRGDNWAADWIIQRGIAESLRRAKEFNGHITAVITELAAERTRLDDQIARLSGNSGGLTG